MSQIIKPQLPIVNYGNPITRGLVLCLPLGDTGGSIATDISEYDNPGTWQGTIGSQWSSGLYGACGKFNGTNNWIKIPDSSVFDFTTAVSISAWINKSNNNPNQPILSKRSAFSGTGIPYEFTTDSTNGLRATVIGNGNYLNVSNTFTTGIWYHVAMTWDGVTLILYLNGVQVATKAVSGTITTNTHEIMIGTDNESNEWFTGSIGNVAMWNRSLLPVEVKKLYTDPFTLYKKVYSYQGINQLAAAIIASGGAMQMGRYWGSPI